MSDDNFTEPKPRLPSYIAYHVEQGKDDRSHWQKIGAAWETKNNGLRLKVSSIPLNGTVELRPREELERLRAERQQDRNREPRQTVDPKV